MLYTESVIVQNKQVQDFFKKGRGRCGGRWGGGGGALGGGGGGGVRGGKCTARVMR